MPTTNSTATKSPAKGTQTTGKRTSRGPSKSELRKQEAAQRRLDRAIEEAPKDYARQMAAAFIRKFEDAIRAEMLLRATEAGKPTDADWYFRAGSAFGDEFFDAGKVLARLLETESARTLVSSCVLNALGAYLSFLDEEDAKRANRTNKEAA